ncbi:MAG TPA: hypothetical protein VM686_05865 [Polyangiaceae bacterium]|nr:hypothetical protein [Polyangiaceae bacterium]
MLLANAGTGVFLSDGATNVMPVAPHRGSSLSPEQRAEDRAAVHAAWQVSHRHVQQSLEGAFYQGWDPALHQLRRDRSRRRRAHRLAPRRARAPLLRQDPLGAPPAPGTPLKPESAMLFTRSRASIIR